MTPDDDVVRLGTLDLPDGRLVVCDPFMVVDDEGVEPLPGALPAGRYEVEANLVDDPDGGQRVEGVFVFLTEAEPTEWEEAAVVTVDSGVLCFASAHGVATLADPDSSALDELSATLADSARDTWEHASLDGVLACSSGLGDGFYAVSWGYDAEERLAAVAVALVDDEELAGDRPGRGLQRCLLVGAVFGGPDDEPQNVVPYPALGNRVQTISERALLRTLDSGQEVEVEVVPEYDGDSPVPTEITVHMRPIGSAPS